MAWFPLFPMLHFLAFIIYCYLAGYILFADARSPLNLSAAGLIACFALWSGGMFFMSDTAVPPGLIGVIWHVYSIGWITFPAMGFLFSLYFTKQKKLLRFPFLKPALSLLTLFYIYLHWTLRLMRPPELLYFGWHTTWYGNLFSYSFYAYFILITFAGILMCLDYAFKVKDPRHRRAAFFIFIGGSVALMLGTYTEVFLPRLILSPIPLNDATDILILFWGFPVLYAVNNQSFFKVTPASAAENIISSMNEALIMLNDSFEIIYLNDEALNLFGCGREKLLGHPYPMFFSAASDAAGWMKTLLKNGSIKNFETTLRSFSGGNVDVMLSSSLIREDGDIAGAACVVADIREIKKSQHELKESYEKLKELDVVKESFMSMVSHELRTPVTAIKGFSSFLAGGVGGELTAVQKEYIDNIRNNSDRLLVLINDLLDTAKMESGSFSITKKTSDVKRIIEQCASDIRSLLAKKSITLAIHGPDGALKAEVDPYRLAQAVTNLLNNAIKFSPALSTISITADIVPSFPGVIPSYADISRLVAGPYVSITITDRGMGIDESKLQRIFEKFYQAENINTRSVQGTGLGLGIVKNIIELHGGAVWAESKGKNNGSSFIMLIPAGSAE